MPPVSIFGSSDRSIKKQSIIQTLKIFFEKYFGIGAAYNLRKPEDDYDL